MASTTAPTPATSSSCSAKAEASAEAGFPSSHADATANTHHFPPGHFPPSLYDLCAVIVHHGPSLKSGHFTAFVRRPSETWYHIDDEVVTKVDPSQVTAAEAYLLFYERRQLGLVCEENELDPKNFELEAQRNFITLYQHVLAVLQKATAHGSEEDVAKQAIMFLTTFLNEKKELEDGTAWGSSLNLVERGMGQLVELLLVAMCKPDEDEDSGFTLANAAAKCLAQTALTLADEVVGHVIPFIRENMVSADWHRADAATLAWGCIQEGPSVEALQPWVVPVLKTLLSLVATPTMALRVLFHAAWAIKRSPLASIQPSQWQAMLREGSVDPSGATIEAGVLLRVFREHCSTAEQLSSSLSSFAAHPDTCVPPSLELQEEREGLLCVILQVIMVELGEQAAPHAAQLRILTEKVAVALSGSGSTLFGKGSVPGKGLVDGPSSVPGEGLVDGPTTKKLRGGSTPGSRGVGSKPEMPETTESMELAKTLFKMAKSPEGRLLLLTLAQTMSTLASTKGKKKGKKKPGLGQRKG